MGFFSCFNYQTQCCLPCNDIFNSCKKPKPNTHYSKNFKSQMQEETKFRYSTHSFENQEENKLGAQLSINDNNDEEEIKQQDDQAQNEQSQNMNSECYNKRLSQELKLSLENTQLSDLSNFVEAVFDPSIHLSQQYNQVQITQSSQPAGGQSEFRLISFSANSVKYQLYAYKIFLGSEYVQEYKKFQCLKGLYQDSNSRNTSIKSISKDKFIIHYFLLF